VAVIFSIIAYLWYNKAPARKFMGDVGSLALGGLLAGVGLVTHHEFMVAILGFVFVIEVMSSVIQVISFKLRGKRVFKMAPIHHHFELSGMSETSIVFMFWMVGLMALVFGLGWEFFF
ncbi:MAG: phospho-N-acetylmuramoyl-pentapeptide-transferase, partial [Erysipelotrichaceae bacterium]